MKATSPHSPSQYSAHDAKSSAVGMVLVKAASKRTAHWMTWVRSLEGEKKCVLSEAAQWGRFG